MKVLISDPVAPEAVKKLEDAGLQVDVNTGLAPEKLLETIPGYHGIVVRSATKVTREVMDAGKDLKVIARGGIGLDNIDLVAAKEKGIVVVNTPGASCRSVAELAFGHMLSVSRRLGEANISMKAGKWEKKKFKGVEVTGKTLGIIGIGNIGAYLAGMGNAFSMRVIAFDPYVDKDKIAGRNIEVVDLDTLLTESDYISLHVPVTDTTRHMLSDDQFAKMKKSAILVNCSRGGVVDEPALIRAIESGEIKGAAMDVFEKEPVTSDNPITGVPNIYLTPHIGASTIEGQFRVGIEVAERVIETLL